MAKISEKTEITNLSELGDYIDNTPGMAIPTHDCVQITTYDANENPTTILYKTGGTIAENGTDGTLVATVTVVYNVDGNPTSIFKVLP